jgi:hypothetical protein
MNRHAHLRGCLKRNDAENDQEQEYNVPSIQGTDASSKVRSKPAGTPTSNASKNNIGSNLS